MERFVTAKYGIWDVDAVGGIWDNFFDDSVWSRCWCGKGSAETLQSWIGDLY